jgi:NAD dependent epimerase/dehydratase family enzyme
VSWIAIEDLVQLYIKAIEDLQMSGPYNAVAPQVVTNKQLVLQFAKAVNGKFYIPFYVPGFVLKLVLGEMSIEVLKSATVSCDKILQAGFAFQFSTIETAPATSRRT